MNGRSAAESVFIRPVNSVTFNSTYFRPGFLGGDHSFKFGGYWRDSNTTSINHTGGYATVRFPTAADNDCSLAATNCQVDLTRDGYSVFRLLNNSAYVQDTITKNRVTLQLGLRYDYNKDTAEASSIVANPLGGPWLPAIDFPGADPGVAFNDFSPRLGVTYNVTGDGRTLARANYARYFGQVGNGGVATTVNPVGSTTLRYPWIDANRNQVADAGEITLSANPISASTNWSAANPARTVSANSVDPNLKNDSTDEFILGLDREVGRGFAVGGSYIYRKYGNFQWSDREGITSADWIQTTFTPTGCPGDDGLRTEAGNCAPITFFSPAFQQPTIVQLTNVPDYYRGYNGLELTGRKRLANRWMMNTSFAYNATKVNYGSFPGGQPSIAAATITEDPSNREFREGYEYRLPHGGQRHRQHLRQLEVAVQSERSLRAAVRDQCVGVLQRPAGLPAGDFRPDAGLLRDAHDWLPRQRVGSDRRPAQSGRRDTPAELPESRFPRRAADQDPEPAVRPVAGYLQRQQRRHHPGDSQPPERLERQPDPGDRGAARGALRHQGELVIGKTLNR